MNYILRTIVWTVICSAMPVFAIVDAGASIWGPLIASVIISAIGTTTGAVVNKSQADKAREAQMSLYTDDVARQEQNNRFTKRMELEKFAMEKQGQERGVQNENYQKLMQQSQTFMNVLGGNKNLTDNIISKWGKI